MSIGFPFNKNPKQFKAPDRNFKLKKFPPGIYTRAGKAAGLSLIYKSFALAGIYTRAGKAAKEKKELTEAEKVEYIRAREKQQGSVMSVVSRRSTGIYTRTEKAAQAEFPFLLCPAD